MHPAVPKVTIISILLMARMADRAFATLRDTFLSNDLRLHAGSLCRPELAPKLKGW